MSLNDLLADPALLPPAAKAAPPQPMTCVRFRVGSAYAKAFGFPPDTCGTICGRYEHDGGERVSLLIEGVPGVGFATEVPTEELEVE